MTYIKKKIKICILGPVFFNDLTKNKKKISSSNCLGQAGAPFLSHLARSISKYDNYELSIVSLSRNLKRSIQIKKIGKMKIYFCSERLHSIRFNGLELGRLIDLFSKEINLIHKAINMIKPDIIIANWPYEYAYAAEKSKYKYILVNHDVPDKLFYYQPNIYLFVRFLMAKTALKRAKNIITPSIYLKKETQKYSKANIKVIANPVAEKFFLKKKNKKKNNETKKILMVNNGFNERKNTKKAIIAFSHLIRKKLSYKLYLYGNDMEKYGLCYNWAIKQNINIKNIFFKGYIDHHKLPKIYKKFDIYLSTSLIETFGVTYVEAMAAGLPIIAGKNSGAAKEVIKNCGILTDVTSSKSICKSIIKYDDKKFYNQKRLLGIKRAHKYYKQKIIAKTYIDYLKFIQKS